MNTKVARQIEEMKKQTIGVEVEMNSITREKAAKTAAEFFGTRRYQNTAGRNGYSTWSAWDADGREWKFQKDVSISGPDSEKCELVTPILHYSDIELLQELIRRLRKAGRNSPENKRRQNEPLLQNGQSEFPRKAQQQKAENNEPACRHLVRGQRCKLRQKPPLQRQPLPYAQPPRNLYKRHG